MSDAAGWEPPIVTALRRYARRGASMSLLQRLAGWARDWRLLNDWWNIDGRAVQTPQPAPDEPMPAMSTGERRLALVQIAEEYGEARLPFPGHADLAEAFGVTLRLITHDLAALRAAGCISQRLAMDGDDA